jgi:nucleoside-diphosphate-sugar epimerase
VCDNGKAAQLLDWRPTVSLDDGIAKTRAWMEEKLNQYGRPAGRP